MAIRLSKIVLAAALLLGAALFFSSESRAGSCCGGGGASALVLPKFSQGLVDLSFDSEKYHGFWNQDGKYTPDAPGSDLGQYRLNIGIAKRIAPRWQASMSMPYIWNINKYSGLSSRTDGLGDTAINLWYETYDRPRSVMSVSDWEDLLPTITIGTSLTVPTGISAYDNVQSSFDVTGRGFYRVDANALVDKTIHPVTISLLLSYGMYLERPVDREYGKYVQPYNKKLGDRMLGTLALGYISYLESRKVLTYTVSFSALQEAEGQINGEHDPTTGFRKESVAGTIALSSVDSDWTYKISWSHAIKEDGWGRNFPTTDITTLGVSYGFR